jgi:hypothetical protein
MTTPVVSSSVWLSGMDRSESNASATRTYRTKTSFVAVHFDQVNKGRIVFLPEGAMLRIVGPSSCLREAFEVMFENELYNVFEIDLMARSTLICEPIRARSHAVAVCA